MKNVVKSAVKNTAKNETKLETIHLESLAEDLERWFRAQESKNLEASNRDRITLQLLDRKFNEWAYLLDWR